jgi:hypothetical protein
MQIKSIVVILLVLPLAHAQDEKLPEGNNGIAARYPVDKGTEKDPGVILADGFEDYAKPDDLSNRWSR